VIAWLSLSCLSTDLLAAVYFLRSSIDDSFSFVDQLFCGGSDIRWRNSSIALNVQIDNSIKCYGFHMRIDYKRPANSTLLDHGRLNMLLKS
jgi:hypothetical protein